MPKQLEEKLKKEAQERGYSKKRANAFIYGTMRKTGWTPSREDKNDKSNMLKVMKMRGV